MRIKLGTKCYSGSQVRSDRRALRRGVAQKLVCCLCVGLIVAALWSLAACRSSENDDGAYDAVNKADCLPDVPLVAQDGKTVSLATLKGKPVLVDFIYTSCPGPCMMITAKMANVALRLGPELGSKVRMASISIDPEHDGPKQLRDYAEKQGADQNGWLFLTGSPVNIERVLAAFKMRRERDEDGAVAHVVGVFLVGPDGKELREYNGSTLKPDAVAADVRKIISRPSTAS